ncbi:hypothetical protein [Marinobacter sp. BGYM27]|uniref:hypothetical protein n=1 Tax=Marinobacter sp. BGYM27 TaxID=2975597 RepID=UPI0021A3A57B|nr:hypothetical protein [Marinobacter sp. BGYM27]MDG5499363.1 hypothetical protein [Marinobacter sp. BGYM27]
MAVTNLMALLNAVSGFLPVNVNTHEITFPTLSANVDPPGFVSVGVNGLAHAQFHPVVVALAEVLKGIFHVAFAVLDINLRSALSTDTEGAAFSIIRKQLKFAAPTRTNNRRILVYWVTI